MKRSLKHHIVVILSCAANLPCAFSQTQEAQYPLPMPRIRARVICNSSSSAWLWSPVGLLWKTSDSGKTWTSVGLPPDDGGRPSLRQVQFTNRLSGWISTISGIFATGNGGLSWRQIRVPTDLATGDITSFIFDESVGRGFISGGVFKSVHPGVLAPNHARRLDGSVLHPILYSTIDGGATWQLERVPFNSSFRATVFRATHHLVVYTENRIFYRDQTEEWVASDMSPETRAYFSAGARIGSLYFFDERVGWAILTDGNLLRSDDGARTWQKNNGTPTRRNQEFFLVKLLFISPMSGISMTQAGHLLHTNDGGKTWVQIPGFEGVTDFALDSDAFLWVIQMNEIVKIPLNRIDQFFNVQSPKVD